MTHPENAFHALVENLAVDNSALIVSESSVATREDVSISIDYFKF